ncbi:MAG: hypothetical protein IPL87_05260 [Candidatus Moraniibacteriota bacterium]|nr:MAG: hypothetical protein IPL87_05260 [Candidatus Moranbacteria bacterium]
MRSHRHIISAKVFAGVLFLAGSFFVAQGTLAAPSISSVSGTVSSGNTITVSGSGFNTKAHAGPMLWDTFDTVSNGGVVANWSGGTTPLIHQGNLSSYNSWSMDGGGAYSSKSIVFNNSSPLPGSSNHARASFTDNTYWGLNLAVPYTQYVTGSKLYISFYWRMKRLGTTWPRQSKALIGYTSDWSDRFYFSSAYNSSCEPSANWRLHVSQSPPDEYFSHGGRDTENEWDRLENYLVQSAPGVANGQWDGVFYRPVLKQKEEILLRNKVMRTSAEDISMFTMGGAYYDFCANDPATIDIDEIYMDSTPQRVELCDGATWSGRNACEIQIPTAWATGSVSATVRPGHLSAGPAYLYVIDASGTPNASGYPVTIGASSSDTTPPVRSNPAPSGSLTAGTTSTTMTLTTNETATCKYGTTDQAYASLPNTFTTTNSTSHSQTISGLSNGQSYTYHIRCQDTAGNANTTDFTVSFSVANPADTTAPVLTLTALSPDPNTDNTPALTGSATDAGSTISSVQYQMDSTAGTWNACTPNDDTFNAGTEAFTCTMNTALTDGSHTMYVRATDSSGNVVTNANAATDTFTIDATVPTRSNPAPSGSLTAGTTSTTMTLTTNETATCKYGTTDQAYASLPNTFTTTNSTSHSQTISGLSNGQSYTYHIRCQDTAGNANTTDFTVSFSVLSSTPTFSSCSTLTPSSSLPGGYGSPFDLFLSNTPLVAAECTASDIHTLKATIGIPGNQTRVSYTKGYWYNPGTSSWVEYTGACSGTQNGNWCQGSTSATVTHANIDTTSAQTPVTFVGMTCSVQNGAWKCGCRDTSCSSFLWQVQGAGR